MGVFYFICTDSFIEIPETNFGEVNNLKKIKMEAVYQKMIIENIEVYHPILKIGIEIIK
jgi:hypothetical protein